MKEWKRALDFAPLCFHFWTRSEGARIDFHGGRSRRAVRRQGLPRGQAIASARLLKEGRGEISSKALQESQAGLGWKLTPGARILREPGPSVLPQLLRESRPLLPDGRGRFGSWRSRRCAPSRNSFPGEAKTVRDRPPASPHRRIHQRAQTRVRANLQTPAKRGRHADGRPAPYQKCVRARQAP